MRLAIVRPQTPANDKKGPRTMLRVVIIDDNAVTRNLLTTMLTAGGHDVAGDSNTSDAGLARAIKLRPQLLCIDIGSDTVRGMEILDLLRTSLPKVLIFMVSANIDPEVVQGALQRGVHGFIVKPFKSTTVTTIIRNAILKLARTRHHTRAGQPAPDAEIQTEGSPDRKSDA